LYCTGTQITSIPELPASLTSLFCASKSLIIHREKDESIPDYNLRWRAWREENISKPRVQERTRRLKEELMMDAWHPDRVERWLDAGYLECM
jgi:hypothetical protein